MQVEKLRKLKLIGCRGYCDETSKYYQSERFLSVLFNDAVNC